MEMRQTSITERLQARKDECVPIVVYVKPFEASRAECEQAVVRYLEDGGFQVETYA